MTLDVAARPVLYEIPGMRQIAGRGHSCSGADGAPLAMAVYLPPAPPPGPPPAVVIVEGYPDAGFSKVVGRRFMDMGWSISTAQMIAASGMAAITYANRQPWADAIAVCGHVAANASALGVDGTRIALWAASGHGPVALGVASLARCAVLLNPYLCDLDGATGVADAAKLFRFEVPPESGPVSVPVFLVRSGRDEMPGLNASLDRFVARALALNRPLTLVNHPDAPHAFDLMHEGPATRAILRQALEFVRDALGD